MKKKLTLWMEKKIIIAAKHYVLDTDGFSLSSYITDLIEADLKLKREAGVINR